MKLIDKNETYLIPALLGWLFFGLPALAGILDAAGILPLHGWLY